MNKERRSFLRNTSLVTGLLLLQNPLRALTSVSENATYLPGNNRELLIWHTNDLHGQPAGHRQEGEQGVFVDAGDFTCGTDNVNACMEMIRAMNKAGYHAATIGNRELANGQAALAALIPHMQFALVNCNYRFTDQSLARQVVRHKIVYAGSLKIGITGVGPQLAGTPGVTYLPPVEAADAVAATLKKEHNCHVVICLSHLGFQQPGETADNCDMATKSTHIDFVIGGHQQKMITTTAVFRNVAGNEVYLSQAGWNGMMTGKMKMLFNEHRQGCGIQPGYLMS
ncbi:metallophosphoesterase [Chitinophaga ginsengisegetis]|uniref:metallophosphoesterase n=1 Tax=Chitinophaga ginsengisegetis TaxID=393003 RepID=UPI000DBA55CF|nr:metallophosphoesterase [Chitinophaga ginsengisegetis]MDR6570706.1 5'-nucleotidase [Chitinophaga ginsengisegetis]MDR6650440.1 5'-nucleotidase [Chitinophaga ginsengisegetis]MDR6656921.1 5'-nucleotidase [Chitinophaga ginsengisegetis]